MKNVISGIVAYNPDTNKINSLIESLSAQSSHVFVYNNGGFNNSNKELNNVTVIGSGENQGISRALNEISNAAIMSHGDYCICFDQDSAISTTMLSEQFEALINLQNENQNTIAVGPTFIDKRSGHQNFPVFQIEKFWIKKIIPRHDCKRPIKTSLLITSGMMYDLRKWIKVGGFDEKYFIDYVDTEWCLRATSLGFEIYSLPKVTMTHELSDEPAKRILGRLALKYGPLRRYYQTRNSIFLIKNKNVPFVYKFYLILTLIYRIALNLLIDDDWKKTLKMTLHGLADGVLNVFGRVRHG